MYNANYPQAFTKVKQWLKLWANFPISLLGRVAAIKMSILPKLLNFFRALEVYVSHQTIKQIQKGCNLPYHLEEDDSLATTNLRRKGFHFD